MRKLELARAVATQPRLLFADEAMAGLSPAEVEEIIAVLLRLNEEGITIVLIEHIMRAVMSFSTRLVVLVAGRRRSPTACRRTSCATPRSRGPILANSLQVSRLNAGYGAVRVLEDISLSVSHAETVVLLGTNGNGKSTLMKCIMGMVRPSSGAIVAEIDGERLDLDRPDHRGDRRSRHHAGAGGAPPLSQAYGRGEFAARRVPPRPRAARSRPTSILLRDLPGAARAPTPARRQHSRAASSRCWRWPAR